MIRFYPSRVPRIPLLPVLVAVLGLLGSLGSAVLAAPDATLVAVLMLPGSWAAIDRSGLPVVQVRMGGFLVMVNGAGLPQGMAVLRHAPVLLLDAARVPGCGTDWQERTEGTDNDPDA